MTYLDHKSCFSLDSMVPKLALTSPCYCR